MKARSELPARYAVAKQALRVCARRFTPASYLAAMSALIACADDYESWPDDERALATCARIENDTELDRLVQSIEGARAKWLAEQQH